MVENPEFELSGYLEDASEDDVGDKSDPTNHEEMTRKTITGEQIDTNIFIWQRSICIIPVVL